MCYTMCPTALEWLSLHLNGFQKSRWEFESDKYQLTPPYMERRRAVNGFSVTILLTTIKILKVQYSPGFLLENETNKSFTQFWLNFTSA